MTPKAATKAGPTAPPPFTVLAIAQGGRLEYEAILLAASLRAADPGLEGALVLAEPQPGPLWPEDPRLSAPGRALLQELGAQILPFESRHFGQAYPYGNKIEALLALPAGQPFLFLDTDTVVLGPLSGLRPDFARPSASMRREGSWPSPPPYGPGYDAIWQSLYDRFGLNFETSLDRDQPEDYWQRYLYFSASWFFYRDAPAFGRRFLQIATAIRDNPGEALASQSLDPWLDQVALPLVIHGLGGGRPGPDLAGLDGALSCHYRNLPLLYARESDAVVAAVEAALAPNRIKRVMKGWDPARKLVYQGKGARIRALFDRDALPRREALIRKRIKAEGLWLR